MTMRRFALRRAGANVLLPHVSLLWLLALGVGPALSQAAPPPPVTVAKPIVKEIVEYDDFIGRFEAVDQVDIRARVSGYVDKISFVDGATVKAGDLLFTIDQRPYQAALEEAQAALESARARLAFAQGDLDRAESLRKSGNITGQIYDERSQALATAKADVNRAQATLNRSARSKVIKICASLLWA